MFEVTPKALTGNLVGVATRSAEAVVSGGSPVFISATAANIPENKTGVVYTAVATDPDNDVLSYSISAGEDQNLFTIDSSTGAVYVRNPPNFEAPADADANNIYRFTVVVSDGKGGAATRDVEISVTDVAILQPQITFPTAGADLLEAKTQITVSGNLIDTEDGIVSARDISSMTVNGTAVAIDAMVPSRWSAVIPIAKGYSTIRAEVKAANGVISAVQQSVANNQLLTNPSALALDGNFAYVIDGEKVLAANIIDGSRTLISGNYASGRGTGPNLANPFALALDPINKRLFVSSQSSSSSVLAIDIATGNRTVIVPYGNGVPDGLIFDAANNRLFAVYSKSVAQINVSTGVVTPISNDTIGTGTKFSQLNGHDGVIYDADNNRLIVLESNRGKFISVDITTGNRVDLNPANLTSGKKVFAFDKANNRILMVAPTTSTFNSAYSLYAVNATTGVHSIISDFAAGSGPVIADPLSLAFDSSNNRVLVTKQSTSAIYAINLATNARSVVAGNNVYEGPVLYGRYLDVDTPRNRVIGVESLDSLSALFSIDLSSGKRTLISNATIGAGLKFGGIQAMQVDIYRNGAFVLDKSSLSACSLVYVDLASGDRTLISGEVRGTGPAFNNCDHLLTLDTANRRAFIGNLRALIQVDLSTGDRVVISDQDTNVGSGASLSSVRALSYDSVNNQVLATGGSGAIIKINPTNGARTIISDGNTGTGPALNTNPSVAITNKNATKAFIVDQLSGLIQVDMLNGNRTLLPNSFLSGARMSVDNLSCDFANQRCFSGDIVIDLISGEIAAFQLR